MAGAALFSPLNLFSAERPKRTAVDQVALGKTGLKCSRLGFGGGSDSGNVQRALGQETFNRLIRYAYDQGITYKIKTMHAKGREVIGMKLIGDGDFKSPEDRETSIRFAMAQPEIHRVAIGFKSTDEIDEAIQRMNRALAAG